MKNVIHIFGAAGSGTTTLGSKISSKLGYKHMDTDDYYWIPTKPRLLDGSEPLDGKFEKVKKMLEEQNKQDKEKK